MPTAHTQVMRKRTKTKRVNPLDLARVDLDVDSVDARHVDVVAYWGASSYEILDDEIDWMARDGAPTVAMPQLDYYLHEMD